MDKFDLIRNKFKNDNYAQSLGIILDEVTETTVKMHLKLTSEMNNFRGAPHGAAIYSLADAAFSVIGNNQNNISVALNCNINYHARPKSDQILHVKGELLKQTRKIGTYLFNLFTEKDGIKLKIATMMSTLYRTGKPYDPNLEVF